MTIKMIILILTQALNNQSIDLLEAALQKQYFGHEIKKLEINENVSVIDDKLVRKIPLPYGKVEYEIIPLEQLALVIKRTWGPIRTYALKICKALEQQGVPLLNNCDFVEWSHSKITQSETLNANLLPPTRCYRWADLEEEKFTPDVNAFPCIIKLDRGTRGDGVYRADSPKSLVTTLDSIKQKHANDSECILGKGILIQSFIPTNADISVSDYYRINLVNGQPQSAVRFQLFWVPADDGADWYKLQDNPDNDDEEAVDVNDTTLFPPDQLNKIISACPCQDGVVGIDIVRDREGNLFLLEYNDGPNISQIYELGNADGSAAEKACFSFPDAHAICCGLRLDQEICVIMNSSKI